MMHLLNLIQQILREMRARKLRSFLAIFGIVWGTFSILILAAIGHGFYQKNSSNFSYLDQPQIFFWLNVTSKPYQGLPIDRPLDVKAEDVMTMAEVLHHYPTTPVLMISNLSISFQQQKTTTEIRGVSSDYQKISQLSQVPGSRFINPIDIKAHRAVAFLGSGIYKKLAPQHENLLHQTILINNFPFTVIGWADKTNGFNISPLTIYVPYTTATSLWGDQKVHLIITSVKNASLVDPMKRLIIYYLAWRFHFDPTDNNVIMVFDTSQLGKVVNGILLGIEIFLIFCGLMTLGVGGVGVANLMFLTVRERTPEIGLRLAIGAKAFDILFQIICEACVIVASGGVIGFVLALITLFILNLLPLPGWMGHPTLSPVLFLVCLIILLSTALLAGYFPAKRAAQMKPIEALAF